MKKNLGLTKSQKRQLWEIQIEVIGGVMKAWRSFKSPTVKLRHGLEIAYMIKQTLDTHKDATHGKFLSPLEFRKQLWAHLSELETYLEPYTQKQRIQRIREIESQRITKPGESQ